MVTITFSTVNVETGDIEHCSPIICIDKDPHDVYLRLDKVVSAFNSWRSVFPLYCLTEMPIMSVVVTNTSPADFVNLPSSSTVVKVYVPSRLRERYSVPVLSAKELVSYVSGCFIEVSKNKRR